MVDTMSGGCACRAKRFSARIDSDDAYLCHCRMCQRATGSVSIAFKNVQKADVSWETAPDYYQSSPIAQRGYCAACGTSLTFEHPDSEKMDLTVAAFDDPGRFQPTSHFGTESMHRQWLDTTDLPEQRSDAYQPLIDRWMDKVGKLPD